MIRPCSALFCLAVSTAALGACTPEPAVSAKAPELKLAAWEGEDKSWFDDGIDLVALGFSLDGQPASADPLLPKQAQRAELVTRVTIDTVTRDANGEHSRYILSVRVDPNAIVSRGLKLETADLTLEDSNPSYDRVSSNESTVRGKTFIAFFRRYAGPEGPVVHWHLTSDAPDVVQAVQVAMALDSLEER